MLHTHKALRALLTGALGALTLYCGVRCADVLPLGAGLWAAGSFLADPAAAAVAAWQVLDYQLCPPQPTPCPPLPPSPPDLPAQQAAPEAGAEPLPEPAPQGAGRIVTAHYQDGTGTNYIPCGAGCIRNCTSLSPAQITDVIGQGLPFSIQKDSTEPQVLIMHTHTTESYEEVSRPWYHPDSTSRTTDPRHNVVAVGAAIAQQLNQAGICTIQDTTLHDYPSYNGSYGRSHTTVQQQLEQHPTIKVVLDVHRDAIIQQDGTWVKPMAQLPDLPACAQVMLICGADRGGNLPNFRQNLRFAAAWQASMARLWPGLARPVLLDYRYYNQDLTTGSLLIEVGGHANTLDEAIQAGTLAGRALADALLNG